MYSIVTATIKSEGKTLNPVHQLVSIDINQEINGMPTAELVLVDGDLASGKFLLSDETFFDPGKEIEIQLRYESRRRTAGTTVFKGIVIRHNLESDGTETILRIELNDQDNRKEQSTPNMERDAKHKFEYGISDIYRFQIVDT